VAVVAATAAAVVVVVAAAAVTVVVVAAATVVAAAAVTAAVVVAVVVKAVAATAAAVVAKAAAAVATNTDLRSALAKGPSGPFFMAAGVGTILHLDAALQLQHLADIVRVQTVRKETVLSAKDADRQMGDHRVACLRNKCKKSLLICSVFAVEVLPSRLTMALPINCTCEPSSLVNACLAVAVVKRLDEYTQTSGDCDQGVQGVLEMLCLLALHGRQNFAVDVVTS
jgi:hypothetical protein